MEKPTTPAGPNASPWPEDSGSEQGFGATGVFQAFQPDDAKEAAGTGLGPNPIPQGTQPPESRPPDVFAQPNVKGAQPLAEPTVHKVVLGESSADSAPALLERIRMASQEKPATVERPPVAAQSAPSPSPSTPAAKPRGGFTELLRTLEVEMPTLTAPVQAPPPPRVTKPAASESSGFTSLLRTLSGAEGVSATTDPVKFTESASGYVADEVRETPPTPARGSGSGGFTELFRAAPAEDGPQINTPVVGDASGTAPSAAENKPGSFTQMFSKVGAAEVPAPLTPPRDMAPPMAENKPGSFTQLFGSIGGTEVPAAPAPVGDMATPAAESKPGSFTQLFGKVGGGDAPVPISPVRETPPPPAESKPGSFTQMFGAVGSTDTPAPTPTFRDPAPPSGESRPESLTQMFSVVGKAETPAPVTRAPESTPPENKPGSFTQLFGVLGKAESSSPAPMFRDAAPPPAEAKPGSFTQLFGNLSASEAAASNPAAGDLDRRDSSGTGAGTFTRMLSLEPQPVAPTLPPLEEQKPIADRLNFGLTPETGKPAAASGDPFAPKPFSEAQPAPTPPQAGGVGITQLIRMLDDPSSKTPTPRREEAPLSSPQQGVGPGAWTQTFASLSEEPAAPKSKAPDWAPPQALPPALGFKAAPEVYPQSNVREPAMNAPAPSSSSSGPSEFTRILDASRIREMAMKGEQAAAAESAPAAPPPQRMAAPIPPPPPPPMPNYSVPVAPPAVGMHGGGVPRPGVYPPSVPQAPGMYAPTPHVPQAPGMYIPPPPMPAVPQAPPPPKPAVQPPANKMQQIVPILLVVVIVLLVVLIVTVIFLMKH